MLRLARLTTSHLTTGWPLSPSLSREHLSFSPLLQLLTSDPWMELLISKTEHPSEAGQWDSRFT